MIGFHSTTNPDTHFLQQQNNTQVFYAGGVVDNNVLDTRSTSSDVHTLPTDLEFRTAFRYFLLNFTLNGTKRRVGGFMCISAFFAVFRGKRLQR